MTPAAIRHVLWSAHGVSTGCVEDLDRLLATRPVVERLLSAWWLPLIARPVWRRRDQIRELYWLAEQARTAPLVAHALVDSARELLEDLAL
jgi:hypothetical protein